MKKRIITIVGARPQFIKAAALSRIFKNHPTIQEIMVHTGQHHDVNMSDVFFDELQIPQPSYNLKINGGTHGHMTGRMLEGIENVLLQEKPEAVLVYGDTNSTLAGALASSKLGISVMHIESGLRSYNRSMPEEINRVLTDHISDLLFCPTKVAVDNLAKEGITKGVCHTGDVMYDSTLYAINKIKNDETLKKRFSEFPSNLALMTLHRVTSTQSLEAFNRILDYVIQFSLKQNLKIIFPVHPRTKELIKSYAHDNIFFVEPLSYFEIQFLLTKAQYVLTDSGGLQKEAYFHRVPCITLRSETEWTETVLSGWNRLWIEEEYSPRIDIKEYGEGMSAKNIVNIIESYL